ncbi:MAG: sodium/solute symporter [Alphaproteobacteria bacterium]|nr:sodium/solute symporter [Alphaproteobacteria bacterium]MDE2492543.1 sodium/solute symporter [Alphaproteobacteria bacterium]
MHLSPLDLVIVAIYILGVLALAQFASSRKLPSDHTTYTSSSRTLPWWAIGLSLIAANISAEQIIGMSGSAYALGLAIASYEWMGAATLLIVGKFFLPIFLTNQVSTMPQFLKRRYGTPVQIVMAILWIGVYVFVALTASLWLGAVAVHIVTGLSLWVGLILLSLFAGNYALYVEMKSPAYADLVQVSVLVLGGLVIAIMVLERIEGGGGLLGLTHGFSVLATRVPDHFHMILRADNPYYKYVPGLAVVFGGMWVINLSYWGFNQYIVQRALTAKNIAEVQKGVVFAAFLKLLVPALVVLPGIAAVVLLPHLSRPDEAYPRLMITLPNGLLGLVFVALLAAIIASMRSALSSIATIFTMDVFGVVYKERSQRQTMIAGQLVAIFALAIATAAAIPFLKGFDQAFQYIQDYSGFITPGVVVVFLLGIFWKRATQAGALAAAIGCPIISAAMAICFPEIPFMNRIGYVFVILSLLAVAVSLADRKDRTDTAFALRDVNFWTGPAFNVGATVIIAILIGFYALWW